MAPSLCARLSCFLALLGASLYASAKSRGLTLAEREVPESGEGCLLLLADLERALCMEVLWEPSEGA